MAKMVEYAGHMHGKVSFSVPVSKFRILHELWHILSAVEAHLASAALVDKKHARGPRHISTPLQCMRETTESGGVRSHARVASNRRSKLTPWWPSYLFEQFLGVIGRNTLKIFHVEEKCSKIFHVEENLVLIT